MSLHSFNSILPKDVVVRSCREVAPGFDARHDAVARSYEYRVLHRRERPVFERGHVLWWPHRLDVGLLHACAALLVGRHDFTAFTPTETLHRHFHREVLAAAWEAERDLLCFRIEADAFLRTMNRVLVGTMLQVATGRRTVESFGQLLLGAPREQAGPTAPAHGLYLAGVRYPDEDAA